MLTPVPELNDFEENRERFSVCACCGARAATESVRVQEFAYGAGCDQVTLAVEVPVTECSSCEMAYTGEEGELIRSAAVKSYLESLSAST